MNSVALKLMLHYFEKELILFLQKLLLTHDTQVCFNEIYILQELKTTQKTNPEIIQDLLALYLSFIIILPV